ncbi:NAD-dependent succinate-semialdehyde dehydrogenase [Leucobacter weissii]|uniref:NAD-dependent succinate-semialdehyde dehydrogenase n=1 Tax=Leucobacter weissii TaxID=1983706 RepID=A0A939MNV4_9MICO|nr:NAD-dependent succinate-semialdehyde dehydrogenase [Leucobacter weissii]MBO1900349.1 NAD-dependent succinate-semialdehyde dehydrogenase [Leucobacter weissii]
MSMGESMIAVIDGTAVRTGLFLDGEWVAAGAGGTFGVFDPATEEHLADVASATPEDAIRALDAASRAQKEWGRTPPRERAELLRRAFALIEERREQFAAVLTAEMGKPVTESLGEVAYGNEFMRWFSEQAAHVNGGFGQNPSGQTNIVVSREPVGPSLLITPWNFPLAMGTRKVGAALAAGCTVIIKPAALTPLTMALFVQALSDAGVPPGVVGLLPSERAGAISSALMADARLRKVSFTGSTAVGSILLRQAAEHVQRSSMELGGNGPLVVLGDADVDAAVEGALIAKFRNGGQSCVAANRIIVHRDLAERFTDAFVERVRALRLGDGREEGVDIGPMIDRAQRDRVAELVDGAVAQGATVRVGGAVPARTGSFYPPTVLTGVSPESTICNEEIFGPVATVTVAASDEEALRLANDTPYGLVAFVFSQGIERALWAAGELEAGMVGINRGLVSDAAAPFGGIKASGLGREGGDAGIEEYLETKYVAIGK